MTRLTDDEIKEIEELSKTAFEGCCKDEEICFDLSNYIPRLLAEVKALRKIYEYSANMCGAMECADEEGLSDWYLKTQKAICEYEHGNK